MTQRQIPTGTAAMSDNRYTEERARFVESMILLHHATHDVRAWRQTTWSQLVLLIVLLTAGFAALGLIVHILLTKAAA